MRYELWDTDTGNRVGSFESEGAALVAVRDDVRKYGRDSDEIRCLGLLKRGARGSAVIAQGTDLASRALSYDVRTPAARSVAGTVVSIVQSAGKALLGESSPRRAYRIGASSRAAKTASSKPSKSTTTAAKKRAPKARKTT
jgi:hypothetical protein